MLLHKAGLDEEHPASADQKPLGKARASVILLQLCCQCAHLANNHRNNHPAPPHVGAERDDVRKLVLNTFEQVIGEVKIGRERLATEAGGRNDETVAEPLISHQPLCVKQLPRGAVEGVYLSA